MSMRRMIERIFKKYGTPIVLRGAYGDQTIRGFWQHTGSLGWHNMQSVYSPLGEVPRGQYLLLVPMDPPLKKGNIFMKDGVWYVIRRVEKMWHADQAIYRWCLCEEGGKEGTWASRS